MYYFSNFLDKSGCFQGMKVIGSALAVMFKVDQRYHPGFSRIQDIMLPCILRIYFQFPDYSDDLLALYTDMDAFISIKGRPHTIESPPPPSTHDMTTVLPNGNIDEQTILPKASKMVCVRAWSFE